MVDTCRHCQGFSFSAEVVDKKTPPGCRILGMLHAITCEKTSLRPKEMGTRRSSLQSLGSVGQGGKVKDESNSPQRKPADRKLALGMYTHGSWVKIGVVLCGTYFNEYSRKDIHVMQL